MDLPVLDAREQRVLGSLLEKQTTVPASYPMTINAVRTACNQTSSRDPIVDYSEPDVQTNRTSSRFFSPRRVSSTSGSL